VTKKYFSVHLQLLSSLRCSYNGRMERCLWLLNCPNYVTQRLWHILLQHIRICLDGLRKTTKNSNTAALEYGGGGLTVTQPCSVEAMCTCAILYTVGGGGEEHIGSITNVNCRTCCSGNFMRGNNNLIPTSFTCSFTSKEQCNLCSSSHSLSHWKYNVDSKICYGKKGIFVSEEIIG